ncbi:DUF7504 family protein [Halobaculum sp. P14]|uniref:DUF7504 family protein n=1 Tax=Halobaculum sp. P14 TaxID=3421638 RepID=UPI003EC004AE
MSGTLHTTVNEGGAWPSQLADASNVLVLDEPHGSTAAPGERGRVAGDGPLLLVAFTQVDVEQLAEWPTDGRTVLVADATPQGGTVEVDEDRLTVEPVSSPANLTELGVAIDKLLASVADEDGQIDCQVPSLTTLLQYVDRQRCYRFCNAVVNRLASEDAVAVYGLVAGAHDECTVDTFASLMDAVVRVDADGATVTRRR